MYDKIGAGHEECTTKGCKALGMHDRKDAGHEECMTGGMQDMRNAQCVVKPQMNYPSV